MITPPLRITLEEEEPLSCSDDNPQYKINELPQPIDMEGSLQSDSVDVQEPEIDNVNHSQEFLTPIQAHSDESHLILVSQAGYHGIALTFNNQEVGESSIDQLSHQLIEIHLELQHKERELQARQQEMQQNSDLLAQCKELEKQVRQLEDEVRAQKSCADTVANEKDNDINYWKKQCKEKQHELEMLHCRTASIERERAMLAELAEPIKRYS